MAKTISSKAAYTLLVVILGLLTTSTLVLQIAPQLPLLLCMIILSCYCAMHGYKWLEIEEVITKGIAKGLKPICILILVGMLTAAWMVSGTVPYIIQLGLQFLSPTTFLPACILLTIIVSSFTGSSFTTLATIGPALMAIATIYGFNPGITAGAIISGACFGDKMSPLSDTTNFASAVSGIELYEHIVHMLGTTLPALLITLGIFFFYPVHHNAVQLEQIELLQQAIANHFVLSPLLLLTPLIVIVGATMRMPILPLLIVSTLLATCIALFNVNEFTLQQILNSLHHGLAIETGSPVLDNIVNRGGLDAMLPSVLLIMIAMAFGALAMEIKLFEKIYEPIQKWLHTQRALIAATGSSAFLINLLTGEMYLSLLLPGQLFADRFTALNIPRKKLSRTLEDFGTLINPLIPWGVSGVFFAKVLQVDVLEYLPYATFCYLCPVFSLILANQIPIRLQEWRKVNLNTKYQQK